MPSEESEENETGEHISKEDVRELVEMFSSLLEAYGSFASTLGKNPETTRRSL